MALENLPLWPFNANWTNAVNETLEWATDVLASPTGAEQRRSLRPYPRRTLDFDVALFANERAYADNLLDAFGGGRWWLPTWHEPYLAPTTLSAGATFIPLTAPNGIKWDAAVVWASATECQLLEVSSLRRLGLTLAAPLSRAYSNAVIYPAVIAQLTDQPRFTKQSDAVWTGEVRFVLHDTDPTTPPADVVNTYLGYPALTVRPNDSERLTMQYERLQETLDNNVGHPLYLDTAGRHFALQKHTWVINGRQNTRDFEAFLKGLRGRLKPLWVPTFHQDFEPVSLVGATLTVKDTGFVLTGGPRRDKTYLRIETVDGVFYRRITTASVSGLNEVLTLSGSLPRNFTPSEIMQISFLTMMRLNTDTLQISHLTDTDGTFTCEAIFRAAPDIRTVEAGF